jgi:hypothetical protein
MSFIVSAACVRLKCPGVAKNVLMQLADIANDHGYAWPAIETICMRTDWGRSAVIDAINWLEAHGALKADRSNGRKTVYRITPSSFDGARYPERSIDPSASRTGSPAGPVRQPDRTRPPAGPDPSAKRTLISMNHQEPIPPNPPLGGECGFDAIAAGYPRRAGMETARREWEAIAPDAQLQAEIARAIKAWIPSDEWQRDGRRYIPKFCKFLRDKRWLDAPGTAAEPRPPIAALPPARVFTPEELAVNKRKADEAVARVRRSAQSQVVEATA